MSAAVMMPFAVQADEHEMVICEADGSEAKTIEECPPTIEERIGALEQRAAELVVYGSIRNAIDFTDPANPAKDSTTDISSVGSRLGFKGSADLGNGLTARGHYQFGLNADQKANGLNNRIATVGVAGGFGSIDVGQQWSAFYNTTGVDMDPTPRYGGIPGTPYRASNTIKYANSVGPLTIEADLRLNGGGDEAGTDSLAGDGGGLGVRVAVTDNLTLAAAYDTEDRSDNAEHEYKDGDTSLGKARGPETDRVGVSGKLELGQFWGTLAWSSENVTGTVTDRSEKETEYAQIFVGASLTDSTSAWVGYGQSETEREKEEPSVVNVGLSHSLGGGMSLFYEGRSEDADKPNMDSEVKHYVALRFDF